MDSPLLDVQDISASVQERKVLCNLSLTVNRGEIHVVMGPNGAGKSTLGNVLMANPVYKLESGKIFFNGKDITEEKADSRARDGLFMSFQNPIEIPGISLESFIRSALLSVTGEKVKLFQFQKKLKAACQLLHLDESFSSRELNVGFSGGERKKSEILQLIMLSPLLAILDETDSGLDVDAVRAVSFAISKWQKESGAALIIITHSTRILEHLTVDKTHVLVNGQIKKSGGAEMIELINDKGFEAVI